LYGEACGSTCCSIACATTQARAHAGASISPGTILICCVDLMMTANSSTKTHVPKLRNRKAHTATARGGRLFWKQTQGVVVKARAKSGINSSVGRNLPPFRQPSNQPLHASFIICRCGSRSSTGSTTCSTSCSATSAVFTYHLCCDFSAKYRATSC
jgi:hypothetical protein